MQSCENYDDVTSRDMRPSEHHLGRRVEVQDALLHAHDEHDHDDDDSHVDENQRPNGGHRVPLETAHDCECLGRGKTRVCFCACVRCIPS